MAGKFYRSARERTARRKSLRFPMTERDELAKSGFYWPGNVRQLKAAVATAVLSHEKGRKLMAEEVLRAAKHSADPPLTA